MLFVADQKHSAALLYAAQISSFAIGQEFFTTKR